MAYSSNKPYQRVSYRPGTEVSYDRLLKEGSINPSKESVLEKPYKSKTYAEMQQEFNIPTPPPFDWGDLPVIPGMDLPPPPGDIIPIGGTGALQCWYTSTGCEQLVGCWAGSDLVLDGPEAATAGYQATQVAEGEIVSQTISGSENRGIEFVLNPLVPRNLFTVSFKDANGVVASQSIDIECAAVSYIEGTFYTGEYHICTFAYDVTNSEYIGGNSQPYLAYRNSISPDVRYDFHCSIDNIIIPQGATIGYATMTIHKETTETFVVSTADIYGYNLDNGLQATPDVWLLYSGADIELNRTTAIPWNISQYNTSVSDGTAIVLPDLKDIIQTIIDRPGWSSGNKMSFIVCPTAGDELVKNEFENWYDSIYCVSLTIGFI